jgi:hypothetical protein
MVHVWGMFFQKCHYANITNDFFFVGLSCISIKVVQSSLHKCITWPKNIGKGRQAWEKTCIKSGFSLQKLNTPMKTRLFFFIYSLGGGGVMNFWFFLF